MCAFARAQEQLAPLKEAQATLGTTALCPSERFGLLLLALPRLDCLAVAATYMARYAAERQGLRAALDSWARAGQEVHASPEKG